MPQPVKALHRIYVASCTEPLCCIYASTNRGSAVSCALSISLWEKCPVWGLARAMGREAVPRSFY